MPYLITIKRKEDVKKVMEIVTCCVLEYEDITNELRKTNGEERDLNRLRKKIHGDIIEGVSTKKILDRYENQYSEELLKALIDDIYEYSHHVINRKRK